MTSLASFEIFSAAAALRARSETAGTTSPQLKAGRSPPQCCRAPLDALLCREVPKRTNTGRNLSLSAQNSPRTASQRVIFNPQHAKVVIFACVRALFRGVYLEPTRTGFLKMGVGIGEQPARGCSGASLIEIHGFLPLLAAPCARFRSPHDP